MTKEGEGRPTTGRYSEGIVGHPGINPRRADACLRDFSKPCPPTKSYHLGLRKKSVG